MRHAGPVQDLVDAVHQLLAPLEEGLEDRFRLQDLQRRGGGGGADSVAGVGSAVGHPPRLDHHHHLLFPTDGGDGEAVAHRLGVGDQVGLHAEVLLRPTPGDPETGLYLIKDEHDTMTVTQFPDLLQPAGLRHDARGVAQDRLDHNSCQFVPVSLHCLFQPLKVIEGQVDDVAADALRNAGTHLHVDGVTTRAQSTRRGRGGSE